MVIYKGNFGLDNGWGYAGSVESMALILDGNSGIGAHVKNNLCYLICLRHMIRSGAVKNQIFSFEKIYFPSCVHNMF